MLAMTRLVPTLIRKSRSPAIPIIDNSGSGNILPGTLLQARTLAESMLSIEQLRLFEEGCVK